MTKSKKSTPNNATTLYLAYGSNLNLQQMSHRCPTAKVVGATEIHGYRLLFRGGHDCAVATIEPEVGMSVPALVWAVTEADVAALDRYEGFPYLYRKETLTVELGGKPIEAMVYIMNDGRPLGMPSCFYYSVIREGYISANFDIDTLKEAAELSSRE